MRHIELFAGCGGLSLGFESEGFELQLANELSPMAAETFAYNHLGEDVASGLGKESRTYWMRSNFDRDNVSKRLREDPTQLDDAKFFDLNDLSPKKLKGSLLVGSIINLNEILSERKELKKELATSFGAGEIDLVSGGPPCQSFSMAGLRKKNDHKNKLPWEFARFVDHIRPKVALLENVSGILRAFTENGVKFHAWLEVSKAFAQLGYLPICLHINAKYVGAAQNRPRFIMLAIRSDVAKRIPVEFDRCLTQAIEQARNFKDLIKQGRKVEITDLKCYSIEDDIGFFRGEVFGVLASHYNSLASVKDAIGDLQSNRHKESPYVTSINKIKAGKKGSIDKLVNHELRSNNPLVQARFRVYQIMSALDKRHSKQVSNFLRDPESCEIDDCCMEELLKHDFLDSKAKLSSLNTRSLVMRHLASLKTKKQTQRALIPDVPAPAALSIPDDACHWNKKLTRTLTVREMARIQSFPDWFVFRSKVTTGGRMRRFEVPQYTQVGNAVPPLLGQALAKVVKTILNSIN
jgi:DNA (cytosine-5)-methyltransferase 1